MSFNSFFDWDNFWDKYKKIKAGYTREEKSKNSEINFKNIIYNFSKNKSHSSNKTKQAMVKNISNLGKQGTQRCLNYILKNSDDGFALNEKGEKVDTKDIMNEWENDFGKNKNSRDSWHLVFSINENFTSNNIKALKDSVKETLRLNFSEHKYAMVLHSHQNNPHIHVVLNKRNVFTKNKLHFDSKQEINDFFNEVRSDFAYALGARGLKYENNSVLNKDLNAEYEKVKKQIEISEKDYECKDKINDFYLDLQRKFKTKNENSDFKIYKLENEYKELKATQDNLFELFLQYHKKKNKKAFKFAMEYKKAKTKAKECELKIKAEYKNNRLIKNKSTQLNQAHMSHYKDQSRSLILLENFCYSYEKIYNKSKLKTKSDFEKYVKARRAMSIMKNNLGDKAIAYFNDSLITTRIFGKNDSLFDISKKLSIINNNLHFLNQANIGEDERKNIFTMLNKNRDFIKDIGVKRFDFIENKLLNSADVKNDSFLFKEYIRGLKILDKRPNAKLTPFVLQAEKQNQTKKINKKVSKSILTSRSI